MSADVAREFLSACGVRFGSSSDITSDKSLDIQVLHTSVYLQS